ncbi:UNVERIFIED_CONTAM: GrpE protein2, mitochondrial [Sesamum latifolium]|uniref:GrpE protein homolog n=1 Tax=Sesamum latifolium TaxID=2727402 RepID=A0AAW2TQS3_9LAMI
MFVQRDQTVVGNPISTTAERIGVVTAPLHQPGIEPGSVPWQGTILPLDHWCLLISYEHRIFVGKVNQQFDSCISSSPSPKIPPKTLKSALLHAHLRSSDLALQINSINPFAGAMSLSRITTRFSRTVLSQCRNSLLFSGRHENYHFHSFPRGPVDKAVSGQVSLPHDSALNSSAFQWFGFSSSASPQPNEKETLNLQMNRKSKKPTTKKSPSITAAASQQTEASGSARGPDPNTSGTVKRRRGTKRVAFSDSDSDSESDLSRDDLVKLVAEKEQLLATKQEELETMKDKVLRTFAEMENVKERTRRESENAKKFAIQSFAKSLLDVADNLGRASSAAKESFSKIDTSKDTTGAVHQLKTLLEGVKMTEKQLIEVFKKFGLEKYNPVDEEFDPNRHNAVFQVPDASKPADRVAVVLKAGYMLHDRVIRPAEVGVTVAVNNDEAGQGSEA